MRRTRPLAAAVCALSCVALFAAARPGSITRLTLDPETPVVELFEGIDQGVFDVRLVMSDEFRGRVQITNLSDQPQTVEIPKALVGVHVLKQVGPPFAPGNQTGLLTQPYGQTEMGPGQAAAGQAAPWGAQSPAFNGFPSNTGPSFFTIPPEKIVQLRFHSVCIDHGKPAPIARMTYVLRRLEDHTSNAALVALIANADRKKTDRFALQAAAWHLANDMSWEELNRKTVSVGGIRRPYFARQQLAAARQLVRNAKQAASDTEGRQASR